MRVGVVRIRGASRFCVFRESWAVDVAALASARGVPDPAFRDLASFLAGGSEAVQRLAELYEPLTGEGRDFTLPLEGRALAAPVVRGAKILCHVINYAEHGAEAAIEPPERPFFFYKPASAVVGPFDPIVHHRCSGEMDYEVELAAVIGRPGRNIPAKRAYEHVAGYVVLNDVSYRDLQFNRAAPALTRRFGPNWTQGKGLDGSCPVGPWITLTNEVAQPYPLRISSYVDDVLCQDASTEQQIFKLPALVEAISSGMTLRTGDIIATGTPAGGGIARGGYLRPGQVVRCEIENLGAIVNEVVDDDGN